MIVGVPREVKEEEYRVAITQSGVSALTGRGHKVLIEKDAGLESGITDADYEEAGAKMVPSGKDVWEGAEFILKVREPEGLELDMLSGHLIFSYLHLAANEPLTKMLLKEKVTAIAYETVETKEGYLPLLAPMSQVCGRLSIQVGAYGLERTNGGSGVLLSGVAGVAPAKVTIIGGGVAGFNAAQVAVGMGAEVFLIGISPAKLKYTGDMLRGRAVTVMSNSANIEEHILDADLVVGAALIPGAKTPLLMSRDLVSRMKPGSVIVDLSIDQGGLAETSRPSSHKNPFYKDEGVIHYAVPNMPGAVPRTSSFALSGDNSTYVLEICDKGFEGAIGDNPDLKRGVNVHNGSVTHKGVAEALGLDLTEP
ncbi:MAG: alanine dehydrogenase [Deltaproteobacteria bacterium]|uniref:Alanine dehydrogenase n=1 Tax=Candidatus Zymogenus saltonus TaxID=2844893 RepID=A0A9D8K9L5_9DELT|nr:alanine dehydrogenase [Candidatus Zymogenus saltonus]